jgi:hypothetical protein
MGAGAAAFSSLRRAVVAEGPSDMILLPTLLRAATRLDELDYQIAPGLSVTPKADLASVDQSAVNVAYLVDGDEGGRTWRDQLVEVGVDAQQIVELKDGWGLEDLLDREFFVGVYLEAAGRSESFADLTFGAGPIKKQLEDMFAGWGASPPGAVLVADALLDRIDRSNPSAPDHQRVKLAPNASAELKRLHTQFTKTLKSTGT